MKAGQRDLRKASGFYQVKGTDAWMPRTAWRYSNLRHSSPAAASLGPSVFTTLPTLSKLFRVDFEAGKAFNSDWVQVSEDDAKAGFVYSTSKLLRMGAKWEAPSQEGRNALNRAMLVASDHLFVAAKSVLVVHRVSDGSKLAEMKVGVPAWDGLAAAGGRLYLSTEDGSVVCLGGR